MLSFRKLSASIIFLLLFLITNKQVLAADFYTDAQVSYVINEEGEARITYDIVIENKEESAMSKGYDLTLSHVSPQNLKVVEEGTEVFPELRGTDTETHILIMFEKPVTGIGNKKKLHITFDTDSITKKSGEIWEVYIPKLLHSDNFRIYEHSLTVPKSFGDEAYVTPNADSVTTTENSHTYLFSKEKLKEAGVQATFGKFQVYEFDLSYHLENPSWKFTTQEIAIPPDTAVQKMYIDEITPEPDAITTDDDGNWIATFTLRSFKTKDVKVKGKSIIFASPRRLLAPRVSSLIANTKETLYWQSNDPEIQKIAKELQTPENIYAYVVDTLSYNYDRAQPQVSRLGAVEALKHPTDVICMEFTDLFIALSRAAGIPAREIQGYAISDNPKIQPLSLANDVLHSWPEYWNTETETWIPVDPTWGDTTGGKDYLSRFDLKHIAFVIHGKDDTRPYPPGSYRNENTSGKDVLVSLSSLSEFENPVAFITYKRKNPLSLFSNSWEVTIKNNGETALYDYEASIVTDREVLDTFEVPILPPQGTKTVTFTVPIGFAATKAPNEIFLYAGDQKEIIPFSKQTALFVQLLVLFLILSSIGIGLYLITKKRHHETHIA